MELAATGAGTDLPGTVQDQTPVVPVVEQPFLGRVLCCHGDFAFAGASCF